jgi:hypothetical protein
MLTATGPPGVACAYRILQVIRNLAAPPSLLRARLNRGYLAEKLRRAEVAELTDLPPSFTGTVLGQ